MGAKKENTAIVGGESRRRAVCCAGPILRCPRRNRVGHRTPGPRMFGSLAILFGAAAVALVFVRRREASRPPAETPQGCWSSSGPTRSVGR